VLAIDDLPQVLAAEAPLAAFLSRSAGPWVGTVVSIGVVAAIFNAIVAATMGLSRTLFAIGRDGLFPAPISRLLATLHPRFHSPTGAVLVLAVVGGLCVLLGEKRLVLFVSGNFSAYLLIALGVIAARKGSAISPFRAPLHPLLPICGLALAALIVVVNWADAETARLSMAILLGTFIAAFIWHEARVRQGKPPVVLTGSDIDD
jgi:amino acid transporter